MNESYAIRLCLLDHDPRGFEFLVKKYRREAFYHAIMLLGNQDDAADACQESFCRAFAAILHLPHLDAFYPWFYRILRNCCLNMLSRKRTSTYYKKNKASDRDRGIDRSNPVDFIEKGEEQVKIWRVLEQLNPEFREILMMKYLQGASYEEISQVIGIPRGTVMSRLYYARKSFRKHYLAYEEKGRAVNSKRNKKVIKKK
jgi:RNA polymerase sigma-70 factor (ECF subfamily)